MVVQFVARDAVAPRPKCGGGVARKFGERGGDGFQNFLKNIISGRRANGAEHKKPQVRLNDAKDFFRKSEPLRQSRRHSVGADKF